MPPTSFAILAEELLLSDTELLLTQHFTSAALPVLWLTNFVNPILQSLQQENCLQLPAREIMSAIQNQFLCCHLLTHISN